MSVYFMVRVAGLKKEVALELSNHEVQNMQLCQSKTEVVGYLSTFPALSKRSPLDIISVKFSVCSDFFIGGFKEFREWYDGLPTLTEDKV